ncbi:MAG TPA: type I glutamate--ammonia ligase [Lachnospiraceae bacterium]|nr:type I glutamate--ammonia ligase [Lachnospiraceae bacterium]
MQELTIDEVLQNVKDNDVEFVRLQFTDVLGHLKNVAVDEDYLEHAFNNKIMFDGSSVDGYGRVEESDMYLRPDLDTFAILPWRPKTSQVARVICDVYKPDGYPYEGDSRIALKKAIEEAEEEGYTFQVGSECEFYLYHTDEEGRPTLLTHDRSSYFDLEPMDLGGDVRRKICLCLKKMGFIIETSHHEVGSGQQEIDFKYSDALTAADNIITFKLAVKAVAKVNNLYATFMPMPKDDQPGSGMHINMSLVKDGQNIFYDRSNKNGNGLSDEALYFIGGIMKHIKGLTLLANPLINSYKRLAKGSEAPSCIAWSEHNRSPLIRVPDARGSATRIELRSPDAASNPYLLLAGCLKAGLDGIKNKIMPPEAVAGNVSLMSSSELRDEKIERLPRTLEEAINEFEKDELVKEAVGPYISNLLVKMKKKEWRDYCTSVTDWEVENYLYEY